MKTNILGTIYQHVFGSDQYYTRIHDEWYDLTDFKHPGGLVALTLANLRDATALYESHHLNIKRDLLDQQLEKYKIQDPNLVSKLQHNMAKEDVHLNLFKWNLSAFQSEIREIAVSYFEEQGHKRGISPTRAMKATPMRWMEMIVLSILCLICTYYWIQGYWIALGLLPFLMWLSMVNHFHDASHFAISVNWEINWVVMYCSLWFASPSSWIHQHIISHHNYVNIPEHDVDLYHFSDMMRLTKTVPWKWIYKYQHTIGILIMWIFAISWGMSLVHPILILYGTYHGKLTVRQLKFPHKILHILARILVLGWFYIMPWYLGFPWWKTLCWSVYPMTIVGMIFMWFTQINHIISETADVRNDDFFIHQIITSHNVASQSYWMYLLTGGLNTQIEHHLYPSVNHCHLRFLQPKVKALCEKHGISYHESPNLWVALKKHWNLLYTLSIPIEKKQL